MFEELFSDEQKQKDATWDFLKKELQEIELKKTRRLDVDRHTRQIDFEKAMALVQVASHFDDKTELFLSTEQLNDLARNPSGNKADIDEVPCVYIFLSLFDKLCLKVGQSNNARERLVDGHFNISRNTEKSHLSNYYMHDWPKSIDTDEVVGIIFPMRNSVEKDRLAVESGLTEFLNPLMP